MTKRLRRSHTDKIIAGVCGGIGEYLEVDPVVVRLLWIVATVFTAFGPGALCYLLAWVIIPDGPVTTPSKPAEPTSAHDTTAI